MAGVTGLEPAAFAVTGRRSNQLSYTPAKKCICSVLQQPVVALRAMPGTLRPSGSCVAARRVARRAKRGGARRDRTADLLHAMQALSQLSYRPVLLADAGKISGLPRKFKVIVISSARGPRIFTALHKFLSFMP